MCAICGIFNLMNDKKNEKYILENMLKTMFHRGNEMAAAV